jgi:hypothetical protein
LHRGHQIWAFWLSQSFNFIIRQQVSPSIPTTSTMPIIRGSFLDLHAKVRFVVYSQLALLPVNVDVLYPMRAPRSDLNQLANTFRNVQASLRGWYRYSTTRAWVHSGSRPLIGLHAPESIYASERTKARPAPKHVPHQSTVQRVLPPPQNA